MTPEQFCYWLQGITEYDTCGTPNDKQWQVIKDHLATVFHKVTPKATPPVYSPNPLPRIEPSLVPMMEPPMDYGRYNMPNPSPIVAPLPYKPVIIC